MTLTRLSGAKSLRDPLLSKLLGESVASSPLAKARWYEATEVAQLPLIRNKQIEAVKQYASVLFPAPELIRLLMDVNVPKGGFRPRTPPQQASHSPAPSLHVTASWTHGRSWSSRLRLIDPCPLRIPPKEKPQSNLASGLVYVVPTARATCPPPEPPRAPQISPRPGPTKSMHVHLGRVTVYYAFFFKVNI